MKVDPPPPRLRRALEPQLDLGARRKRQRLTVDEHANEQGTALLAELELSGDVAAGVHRLTRVPRLERHQLGSGGREKRVTRRLDARLLEPEVEARPDGVPHRDRSTQDADSTHELDPGELPAVLETEGIGDGDGAVPCRERRLQDVRPVEVASLARVLCDRGEVEAPAALPIEQRREDGGPVEGRQRQPLDRAVARYERERSSVADRGVLADRRVAVCP